MEHLRAVWPGATGHLGTARPHRLFANYLRNKHAASHPGAMSSPAINIVGAPDHVVSAFDRLTTEVLPIGLTPVSCKCAVYGRSSDVAHGAATEAGIAHSSLGVVVADTPIGTDTSIQEGSLQHD
jgi:hypothetical protein